MKKWNGKNFPAEILLMPQSPQKIYTVLWDKSIEKAVSIVYITATGACNDERYYQQRLQF